MVLVNDHLLDPADIMSSDDLGHVLRRGFKEKPPKPHRMRDNEYHQLLLQVRERTFSYNFILARCAQKYLYFYFLIIFINK